MFYISTGYPWHRENRENYPKESLSGKPHGLWKFCQTQGKHRECCQNTGKRERMLSEHRENTGIFFAQVVNALILKEKDIVIFAAAAKKNFFQKLDRFAKSVLCM